MFKQIVKECLVGFDNMPIDECQLERIERTPHMKIIEPASFFEIIRLEKNARVVMTDSGGVQKEAFFFETPCVILRPETEWVEIVEAGAGVQTIFSSDAHLLAFGKRLNEA